jgi:polyisoprenoid-binding protein YceI
MPKWIIDPDHSVGAFEIGHLMVANVHGQMNMVSGTIHLDPLDIAGISVDMEIEVASIITGIKKRDDHLKSQDFFDADKLPKITFKSTTAERTGFNNCKVSGDINIHGITRPLSIEVVISGPVQSPFGETSIGLVGRTRLNREDFGMTWNEPVEKGGFMVNKDVEISVNLEADLAE